MAQSMHSSRDFPEPTITPLAPSPFHRNEKNICFSFLSHNHQVSLLPFQEFARNNSASTCERILIKMTFRWCDLDVIWKGLLILSIMILNGIASVFLPCMVNLYIFQTCMVASKKIQFPKSVYRATLFLGRKSSQRS